MRQDSGAFPPKPKKKRQVKPHWIALVGGCSQMAIGLWLMTTYDVSPVGTFQKIDTFKEFWEPPLDFTVVIDLATWLVLLSAGYSLAHGLTYMLTTKISLKRTHLEWQTGLIHQHAARMQYKDMESVSLYRSWLGAILGYGTVKTWGKGSGSITMEKVTHPKLLLAHIDRKIAAAGGNGNGNATGGKE